MKLFAVFVGGKHPRANIELHDIRFVVGGAFVDLDRQVMDARTQASLGFGNEVRGGLGHVTERHTVHGASHVGPRGVGYPWGGHSSVCAVQAQP